MGGKIKGVEFIFALIATELRNCLTSKIAGWLKPITFTCSIFFSSFLFFSFFSFFFFFFFLLFLPSPRLLLLAPFSHSRGCLFLFELSHFPIPSSPSFCSTLTASSSLWQISSSNPRATMLFDVQIRVFCRTSSESRARTVASTRRTRRIESVSRLSALIAVN